ncbi:hypothetical protein ACHAO4_008965 [Trichoderma viride]
MTSDSQCIAQSTVWSPLLPVVEYHDIDFDNAFNSTSIYRGPPVREREEAWERLTYKNFIEIPESKIGLYNRSSEVRRSLKRIPGEGRGYAALVETFHQLHCLNVIRQYTWFQAGKYHDEIPVDMQDSEIGNRMHVDHCIETVRIALMCYADVTPLFIRDDPRSPTGERADFDSHHRCRNFEKIEEWVDSNWAAEISRGQ